MTLRIEGPGLNMPALPASNVEEASNPFLSTKFEPKFRRTGNGPSERGASQAAQGVTMLTDPKLSFWPPFLSGKRYEDADQLPLTGDPKSFDKDYWVPHVRQGALGDCWFMGTLAAMALAKDPQYHPAIRRIDDEHVAVKFGDREFGVGDDLPFNRKDKLLYARQNAPHFEATWPIYYEKAAASLMGGYKALDGGWPEEAFELMLGTDVKDVARPADVFGYIGAAVEAGLPVAVTTRSTQTDLMTGVKLHSNHTYAVRKMQTFDVDGQPTLGVKLWNPWGAEHPKVLTVEQFQALCDTVTTPRETFGWGGRGVVPS